MGKINKTKFAILGVLSLMPCSGYDIKKFCDSSIAHFWSENYGHIYPVLKQLELDGSISKETKHNEGKPTRNVYHLTDKGKKELVEWLELPDETQPQRLEFLLKMFFSNNISLERVTEKLEKSRENCKHILETYLEIEKNLQTCATYEKETGRIFWISSVRYGIFNMEANIKWCEDTLDLLKNAMKGSEFDEGNDSQR